MDAELNESASCGTNEGGLTVAIEHKTTKVCNWPQAVILV